MTQLTQYICDHIYTTPPQHCINVIQICCVYWDLCGKKVTRSGGNVICCNPREDVVPSRNEWPWALVESKLTTAAYSIFLCVCLFIIMIIMELYFLLAHVVVILG